MSPPEKTHQTTSTESRNLTIFHQNINRLENKTNKLECELQVHGNIDVLCLTELFLHPDELPSVHLENYKLAAHYCRRGREGGGACIYVRDQVLAIERPEVAQLSVEMHFEACAVECVGADTVVVCIYRPPRGKDRGDFPTFFSKLNDLLSIHFVNNYNIIIMGDMNIDMLVKCPNSKLLSETLRQFGFKSLVNFPTRITDKSSTCLDHIYTNMPNVNINEVSPLQLQVSDHSGIFMSIQINKMLQLNLERYKRLFSEFNISNFKQSLDLYDWEKLLSKYQCSSLKIDATINVINHYFNIHFPLKKYPVRNNAKVWVTEDVRSSRRKIREVKQSLTQNPNDQILIDKLINLEKKHISILNLTRKEYINKQIVSAGKDMCRTVWRVIASETGRAGAPGGGAALDVLVSASAGASDCERARHAAVALNRYYIEANNNPNCRPCCDSAIVYLNKYLESHEVPKFINTPISLNQIMNVINKIKRKQSTDINDMSTAVLDYLPPVVISLLCMLFNQCVNEGDYPSLLKQIKVQPIYKGKGEMNMLRYFRPISLIPIISKVFERLISDRLIKHFIKNKLLNHQQYAYQQNRSTVDAARDVVCRVMSHHEAGRQVAAVFCDLSRAFELVNHELLLKKLKLYGITDDFYNTIAVFLRDRKQCTYVRNSKSDLEFIGDCAVPQGSTMGNYLFLILVNDLTAASEHAEYVLFADDGCLIVSAENYVLLKHKLNLVTACIHDWFSANGMLLNIEKTNIVHFQLRRTRGHDLNVVCNGVAVPQVDQVKYLGFVIDAGLTWAPHIDVTCARLASACFALSRLARSLSNENMKKAYYGYFHSILSYGVDLWGNAACSERILRLQKRAVRIIAHKPWDCPAQQLFKNCNILTLPCLYALEVAKYARRNLDKFNTKADFHRVNTRRRNQLIAPATRLAKSDKCINTLVPRVYNALPDNVKETKSETVFIAKLKNILVNMPIYKFTDFPASLSSVTPTLPTN
ncbi:hypothetical protein JYU34_015661 [Plutella xylostella]|uniref:Reverse transcriptase domain-containing protein n=2 Tax=Plutella xylostella TaxID=51655 RepID=A0ABQ7Q4F5_PLUXY|nr:hypothetical protein JYU34_015661 [Plutella xylostella]